MLEMFNLLFMFILLRAVYEFGVSPSKTTPNPGTKFSDVPTSITKDDVPKISAELLKMFPPERIERIKKKELRKYKASQDKKWENWLEAVSK